MAFAAQGDAECMHVNLTVLCGTHRHEEPCDGGEARVGICCEVGVDSSQVRDGGGAIRLVLDLVLIHVTALWHIELNMFHVPRLSRLLTPVVRGPLADVALVSWERV